MRRGTLIFLAVTAAVLAAYIFVAERGTRSGPLRQRRVFEQLEREQIGRLRITRPGFEALVLERGDRGWMLGEPWSARADRALVDRLLAALEFLEFLRQIDAQVSRRQLGLAPPRATIDAGRLGRLRLGHDDPSGLGIYLEHQGRVGVVDRAIWEAIDRPAEAFRDVELVPLPSQGIVRLRIERGGEALVLDRGDGVWRLGAGGARAAPEAVARMVGAVAGLQARRFVDNGTLPEDSWRVSIGGRLGQTLRLDSGGACPGRSAGRLVRVQDGEHEVWACVEPEDLAPLAAGADQLLDRRLTHRRLAELGRLQVERGGEQLVLRREGADWRMVPGQIADGDALRRWLAELREAEGRPTRAALGPVVARLTLTSEGGRAETLTFGRRAAGGVVRVRRDAEPVVLEVEQRVLTSIAVEPLRYRSREVLALGHDRVQRIDTRRGDELERLQHVSGRWRVVGPVQMAADASHVQELLDRLSRLRAARFVVGGHRAFVARTAIEIELAAADKPGRTVRLVLGRDLEGGCAGRLAGVPDFLLGRADCGLLRQRRGQRALLQIDERRVSTVTLEQAGWRWSARRRADRWMTEGHAVEAAVVARLLAGLAGLRGELEHYRRPTLRPPWVRLSVEHEGSPVQRVTLDAAGRAEVDGWRASYRVEAGDLRATIAALHGDAR